MVPRHRLRTREKSVSVVSAPARSVLAVAVFAAAITGLVSLAHMEYKIVMVTWEEKRLPTVKVPATAITGLVSLAHMANRDTKLNYNGRYIRELIQ